jgi:kumamolisin
MVIGGTSAVAPLWAGLIAVANAQNGKSAGFLQPAIYAAKGRAAFNDITSGTNYTGTPIGFKAGPGWDPCTGLGSPIGAKLIAVVKPAGGTTTKKSKKKAAKKTATKKTATKKKKASR